MIRFCRARRLCLQNKGSATVQRKKGEQAKGQRQCRERKVNHHTICRWRELSAHGLSGLCLSVVSLVPSFEWPEVVAPGTVFWVDCSFYLLPTFNSN